MCEGEGAAVCEGEGAAVCEGEGAAVCEGEVGGEGALRVRSRVYCLRVRGEG